MIYGILIFQDNGTLLLEALFEKFEMDSVLITGFTTAINQFGLKIFPHEDLEDIVFTKHHILFKRFKLMDQYIIFITIHDKTEEHFVLKKINQEIYWELKQKYSHEFAKGIIDLNQLDAIKERIQAILVKEHRAEKLIN